MGSSSLTGQALGNSSQLGSASVDDVLRMQKQYQELHQGRQYGSLLKAAPPKEIGYIDRASGLRSGLEGLRERLEALSAKIDGHPHGTHSTEERAAPAGLDGCLSEAEGYMRDCFAVIQQLDSKF